MIMANTSTLSTAGLIARGDDDAPVPLTGVSIEAEITGFCARVAVAHRYVNREAAPIEAVYVFPLDEGAAVCGFEARCRACFERYRVGDVGRGGI